MAKECDLSLLERCRNGDRAAEGELVKRYSLLVEKLVAKYAGAGIESDDLRQEGMVGLLGAIRGFDRDHGSKFITYAHKGIELRIRSAARLERRAQRRNQQPAVAKPEATEEEDDASERLREQVAGMLDRLEEMERRVVCWKFWLCGQPRLNMREMAAVLGCRTPKVAATYQRAMSKLRGGA